MRKMLLLSIVTLLVFTTAQSQKNTTDSVKFYEEKLNKLRRDTWDSLFKSEEYKMLQEKIDELRKRPKSYSSNYTGIVLFGDLMHSDYSKLNNSIAQDGFEALNPLAGRIGFGISNKTDRMMLDIYFITGGFRNKSSKGEEKIETGLSNVLQYDLGYDFVNSKSISIYPFAGLSGRISFINYSKPVQLNPNYTNISNILVSDQSVRSSSFRFGYQAGIGFDFTIVTNKPKGTKTILFAKFGTNRPIGRDKYKIHDIKYKPGIKQADWLITFGVKFANLQ